MDNNFRAAALELELENYPLAEMKLAKWRYPGLSDEKDVRLERER